MKRIDHVGSVVEVHQGEGPPRLPRQAPVGPAQEARSGERAPARMGGAPHAGIGDQGTHAHPSRRLSGRVRAQRHRQRRARALGDGRGRAQPDRAGHHARARRAHAGQGQVDADRRVRHAAVPGEPRNRGHGDRPRRAHPATRRRATEPHRGSGGAQASRRRGPGLFRDDRHRPQEQRRPLPCREPAPAYAALLPQGRCRHDRAPISPLPKRAASSSARTRATPT